MSADNQKSQEDCYVSRREAARIAEVEISTITQWRKRGNIQVIEDPQHPDRYLYRVSDLEARRARHNASPQSFPGLVRKRRYF